MKKSFLLISLLAASGVTALAASAVVAPEYHGSSYKQVLAVVEGENFSPQTEIENQEYSVYEAGQIPQYEVLKWDARTFWTIVKKVC